MSPRAMRYQSIHRRWGRRWNCRPFEGFEDRRAEGDARTSSSPEKPFTLPRPARRASSMRATLWRYWQLRAGVPCDGDGARGTAAGSAGWRRPARCQGCRRAHAFLNAALPPRAFETTLLAVPAAA